MSRRPLQLFFLIFGLVFGGVIGVSMKDGWLVAGGITLACGIGFLFFAAAFINTGRSNGSVSGYVQREISEDRWH